MSIKSGEVHRNRWGDVFEPRPRLTPEAQGQPEGYSPPIESHSHSDPDKWHRDISYRAWGRPAALLAGDAEASFLWSRPTLYHPGELTQGYLKWDSVRELLQSLTSDRGM